MIFLEIYIMYVLLGFGITLLAVLLDPYDPEDVTIKHLFNYLLNAMFFGPFRCIYILLRYRWFYFHPLPNFSKMVIWHRKQKN